ncbi:hypothetical protein A1D29_08290 [Pasteurellaceae bacterium Orientalotternb1]|nr:hypothetical protein A1D29_08290 [Pasteurellaceae bacterium Orientalotternb1]
MPILPVRQTAFSNIIPMPAENGQRDFDIQSSKKQKMQQLQQLIQEGVQSGEAKPIGNINTFCDHLMKKAIMRTKSNG